MGGRDVGECGRASFSEIQGVIDANLHLGRLRRSESVIDFAFSAIALYMSSTIYDIRLIYVSYT